jgi:diguanylate cyclase (GGDEF)-like protein/PAS domain S-box-containing protein
MHPILRKQLQGALSLGSPEKARLEALVTAVHHQYRRFEKELMALENRLAEREDASSAYSGGAVEGYEGLRTLLDNIKDGIVSVDARGRILSVNATAERMFHHESATLVGQNIGAILVVPDAFKATDYLEELARVRESTQLDLAPTGGTGRRADGRAFPVDLLVAAATEKHGRRLFVLAIRDMGERLEAERALRESEARYRSLVDSAPEAIVVLDPVTGWFADANEKALDLFKVNRASLLGCGPEKFSPDTQPDGRPSTASASTRIVSALAGTDECFEWLHRDAQGALIPCEVRLARIEVNGRAMVRASIFDIRDRKLGEQRAAGERAILERIAANAPLAEILNVVADTITRIAGELHPALYVLDENASEFELAAAPSLPDAFRATVARISFDEFEKHALPEANVPEDTVCVADIGTAPVWARHRELASTHGYDGCWSAPIRDADGRVLGAFAAYIKGKNVGLIKYFDLFERIIQLAAIALTRKRAERALQLSESRYRGLFEKVLDGVYHVSRDDRFVACNPSLVQMLGYDSAGELMALPSTVSLYVDPNEREVLIETLRREGNLRNAELRLRRKDGSEITVLENARTVFDEAGNFVGHEGTLSDITERKRAELEVHAQRERAQVTLNSIADGVITIDNAGNVDYLNPVAETLTGWTLRDARGLPVSQVVMLRHEIKGHTLENPAEVCLREGRLTEIGQHSVLVARDGREIPIQDSAAPIRDTTGQITGAVLVVHDVSKERQLRRQLAHHAAHDSLTGLINRREFEIRLETALASARAGASHVLMYLDLDQFKVVNDTCGHTAGDQLLKQVTTLIRSFVRAADTVSRLGGDEFGVLLENCTLERAIDIADAMRGAIRDYRFVAKDAAFDIGASIGLVAIREDSESIGSLLSAADVACYSAKDLGRNRVHVYQHGAAPERHAEMQWVSRITRAIDEGRLELFFQPIVPIGNYQDKRGHYELLIRMRDENGRMVPPNAFIPAAERYNIMPMVDRWVIGQALEHLSFRPDEDSGSDGYTLAINLSGTSLNDDKFLEFVLGAIDKHAPGERTICFEITETAAISNLGRAVHFMKELKARGCEFSLDDFGNGLSSFSYLQNLPVDYIKIDGNFVRNIVNNHVHQCMVDAIHRVGKAMGIRMIAEHVESRQALELLEKIGVEYVQGFHIAAPAPVAQLPRLSARGSRPVLRLA